MPGTDEFYVDAACCLSCGVPHDIAPDLFGWADEVCYVARQPGDERETSQMVEALWSAEASCIRYSGSRPEILRRIAEVNMAAVCDDPAARSYSPVDRNRGEFDFGNRDGGPTTFARRFATFLRGHRRYRVRHPIFSRNTVKLKWWEGWHEVAFDRGDELPWAVRLIPTGGALIGLKRIVQEWADTESIDLIWHGYDRGTGAIAPPRRGVF